MSKFPEKSHYSPLSNSIIDYYKKFGQNRDLEKFLRFHRNCGKSSSEGSIYSPVTLNEHIVDHIGRSMENLSFLKADKNNKKASSSDSKVEGKIEDAPEIIVNREEEEIIKIDKKCKENVKKKKGVNVNVESFIEINMPEMGHGCGPHIIYQQMKETSTNTALPIHEKSSQTLEDQKVINSIVEKFVTETPISKSNLEYSFHSVEPEIEPVYSPASSIASHKQQQKLEWDSLADVGYKKSDKNEIKNDNLSSLERNALNKLFANYGVTLDANIILLASQGLNKKTDYILQNEQVDQEIESNTKECNLEIQRSELIHAKWQKAFKKILEQKRHNNFSINITDPKIHSTPITEQVSKQKSLEIRGELNNDKQKEYKNIEKYCQTSTTELISQGIQVNESKSNDLIPCDTTNTTESYNPGTKTSSINNNSIGKYDKSSNSTNADEATDVDSFEFLSAADYLKNTISKENQFPSSAVLKDKKLSKSDNFLLDNKKSKLDSLHKLSRLEKNLTMGINLMNSLLESKTLSTDTKTTLIKKIIKKLENMIHKHCGSEMLQLDLFKSELSLLKVQTEELNNTEKIQSVESSVKNISKDEKSISLVKSQVKEKKNSSLGSSLKHASLGSSLKNATREEWLQPMTHSEVEYENNSRSKSEHTKMERNNILSKSKSMGSPNLPDKREKQLQLSLVEANIKYLENLKIFLKNGGSAPNFLEDIKFGAVPKKQHSKNDDKNLHSASSLSKSESNKTDFKSNTLNSISNIPSIQEDSTNERHNFNKEKNSDYISWNSHSNELKPKSNRLKLDTPPSTNDSINSFARQKRKDFIEKYDKMKKKLVDEAKIVYTKPYNEYYSNANKFLNKKQLKSVTTSMNSSEVFLSSNSTSLRIPGKTSGTQSNVYFDNEFITNIGTQTTDSLRRTTPVFESSNICNCKQKECVCTRRSTRIINKMRHDKQQQMTPRPLAYTIEFKQKPKKIVEQILNERKLQSDGGSQSTIQENSNSRITVSDSIVSKNSNYFEKDYINNRLEYSLQNYLTEKKPDFFLKAEQRRKYIEEINFRRKERNECRSAILSVDSNISIRSKLLQLPKQKSQNKLFSTQQIKLQAKNKFITLSEVVKRKEMVKETRLKTANKKLMELFNKNLQKKVLKGKTTLSHSMVLV